MTNEEIIEMARQAGLDPDLWNYTDAFERFAKLVAEHEREACAKICDEVSEVGYSMTEADICAVEIRARGQE